MVYTSVYQTKQSMFVRDSVVAYANMNPVQTVYLETGEKQRRKKKQTRCPLYKLSVLCLCSLFQHTHMPGHDAAIVMKCNEISQLHARIESQVDRNTMATQQLQVLHNAYLKQNELQQHIDKLHLEYKHLHSVYQQQLFAAELVADSKTHTH